MTSKVLYELLIRSYEQFKVVSLTSNLAIDKNTHVNNRKNKNHGKLNFNRAFTEK